MAGGGSFTSDQKTAHLAADGQLVGRPCRVTSIPVSYTHLTLPTKQMV